MKLISIRNHPEYKQKAILYISSIWGNETSYKTYEDSISHTNGTDTHLPQWYLLLDGETIMGCGGLITNDFISRMDLFPWLCSLYIEESYRGNNYAQIIIEEAQKDAKEGNYKSIYLATDHIGYYEKFGYKYLADGYHPWGETSRIYQLKL